MIQKRQVIMKCTLKTRILDIKVTFSGNLPGKMQIFDVHISSSWLIKWRFSKNVARLCVAIPVA